MMRYFLLILFFCNSCGSSLSTSVKQNLVVEMYGVYAQPDTAIGNADPIFEKFTFKGMTFVASEGASNIEANPEAAPEFKIIDRPQIIFQKDFGAYDGVSFSELNIEFDKVVTVGGLYKSDYKIQLSSAIISYSQAFSVETGRGLKVTIKVNWRNTITRDTDAQTEKITEPGLEVTVESVSS